MSAPAGGMAKMPAVDAFAATLMVGLTFAWGFNQVAIKLTDEGFNPVAAVVARSVLGGLIVYLWCRYRGIRLMERDATLWPGIFAGAFFGLEFIALFVGLDYTSAARSVLLLNTMPFFVLIGGHFLLGERISIAKVAGILLAFLGVVLVFSDKVSLPGPHAIIGDVLCLAAGLCWAISTLCVKGSRLSGAAAEKTLIYQLGVSAVMTLPFVPLGGALLRAPGPVPVAAFLYQALFVVAVTYVLWFGLMRRYPASGLASFAFLSPVFGVLSGGLVLHEPLSAKIFMALALIGAGLVMVNRRPARGTMP